MSIERITEKKRWVRRAYAQRTLNHAALTRAKSEVQHLEALLEHSENELIRANSALRRAIDLETRISAGKKEHNHALDIAKQSKNSQ